MNADNENPYQSPAVPAEHIPAYYQPRLRTGSMRFEESLRGRIAVDGIRSVLASAAPCGIKPGLALGTFFAILVVLGTLARWQRNETLDLWLLFAGPAFGFCLGWLGGAFANLTGRTLLFLGDRGINLSERQAGLGRWHPQEIHSLEVIDGPKDRITFKITFIDSDRYPPLQFISTCSPDRRPELEQGMQVFTDVQSTDRDITYTESVPWTTKEADQAAIIRYILFRTVYLVGAIGVGLWVILLLALWINTGKSIILGAAAFMAIMFLPLPFLRWWIRTRFQQPYLEAMARKRSKGSD